MNKKIIVALMCALLLSCSSGNVGNGEYAQSEPLSMADQMSVTMYPVCLAKPFNGLVAIANVTPASDKTTTDLFCFDIKTSKIQWKTTIENGTHGKLSYSGFEDAVYVRQDNKLKKVDLASGKPVWESAENIISVEKAFSDFVYCTGDSMNQETESLNKTLMAFDSKKGNLVWTREISLYFVNPQFGDKEIAFVDDLGSGSQLFVLDRQTGKTKKTIERATFAGYNDTESSNIPYVLEDKIMMHTPDKEVELTSAGLPSQAKKTMAFIHRNYALIGEGSDKSQIIDILTGKVLCELNFSVMDTLGTSENVVFFKSSGKDENKPAIMLTAIDMTDGTTKWETEADVSAGNVLVLDDAIAVATSTGKVQMLSLATGKLTKEFDTGKTVYILSKLDGKTFLAVFNGNSVSFWSR